jgi:PAS domain S-box-containing protein
MNESVKQHKAAGRWGIPAGVFLAGVIFLSCITFPFEGPGEILYIAVVGIGLWTRVRAHVVFFACLTTVLTLLENSIGSLDATGAATWQEILHESIYELSAIWVTTLICFRHLGVYAELLARENQLKNTLESIPITITMTRVSDGTILYANPAACKLFGRSREEMQGLCALTLYSNVSDRESVANALREQGSILDREMQFKGINGEPIWLVVTLTLSDYQGEKVIMSAARDITYTKQTESALHQAKDFAENLIETANVMVVGLDTDGAITVFNRAAEEISGYSKSELMGSNWFETLVPRDRYPEVWEAFSQIVTERGFVDVFENPILTKAGEERIISWRNGALRQEDRLQGTISFGIDVTEQRHAEDELRVREREFEALVENAPDAITRYDKDLRLLYLNAAAETANSMTRAQAIGKTHSELAMPDELISLWNKSLGEVFLTGQEVKCEFSMMTPLGERSYEARYVPEKGMAGQVETVLCVTRDITERKQAEGTVRESEQRFRSMADSAPVLIWMAGFNRHTYYFNRSWLRFTGRSVSKEYGLGWTEIVHPDDLERCLNAYKQAFASRHPYSIEYRLRHHDGMYHWILESGAPRFTVEGSLAGYIGSCTDITDRKRAEASLQLERNKLSSILDAMTDGVFIVNEGNDVEYVNPVIEREFGLAKGRKCYEYTARSKKPCAWCQSEKILSGKCAQWEWHSDNSGKTYEAFAAPLRNEDGSTSKLEIYHDITERKRAETERDVVHAIPQLALSYDSLEEFMSQVALQLSRLISVENLYLALYDNVTQKFGLPFFMDTMDSPPPPEALKGGVTDYVLRSGQTLLLTPEFYQKLVAAGDVRRIGTPPNAYIGVPLILEGITLGVLAIQSYTRNNPYDEETVRILTTVANHVAMVIKRKLAEEGIKKYAEDLIHSKRETEEALEKLKAAQASALHSEKMASIGVLSAGIAHEINNPIGYVTSNLRELDNYTTKIRSYLKRVHELGTALNDRDMDSAASLYRELADMRELLKLDFILDDVHDLVEESLKGTTNIEGIVKALKAYARQDETTVVTKDVSTIVENALNMVSTQVKYKAEVIKDYGAAPPIPCNPGQLLQVFSNLLVNAAQAIEKRGLIRIRISREGDRVVICITDNGCGIPEENRHRIFEPFFTTKDVGQGTGLGLSIVYDLVAKHHGDIAVESAVGQGTTIKISLPVHSPISETQPESLDYERS